MSGSSSGTEANTTTHPALEVVEAVCDVFETDGIYGVGAGSAVRAMAAHWVDHLAEGHSPRIISDDIDEAKKLLEVMRAEILRRLQAAGL